MAKGTGLVKSRDRYYKMIEHFPEREEFYLEKIKECEDKIIELGVCKRCGRPLKDEHARKIGYGKECQAKSEAEKNDGSRVDGLRPEREGYSGGIPR